ncbi:MAG: LruC domain-containing protein [Bacteroidales bacterium]|nr:LruC domain-containing protein [Bacteroidales bacterium]
MKNTLFIILFLSLSIAFSACTKSLTMKDDPMPTDQDISMNNLKASANFNWKTTSLVDFHIQTLDNQGEAIPKIKISILTDYKANGGKEIFSGFTNESGAFETRYTIDNSFDSLVISTNWIGFQSEVKQAIENNQFDFVYGGIQEPESSTKSSSAFKASAASKIPLATLGSWDRYGRPYYLERKRDYITADLLADINAALPENKPVQDYHPEYLHQSNEQNINLVEQADIWVTFVSEGAGYLNSLAYYTYDKNNPPQSIADIDKATIIFPNVSFSRSGGSLISGDKVYLGQFPAGTSIAWLLIADGYNSWSRSVTDGNNYFFSHQNLNPETNAQYKQHSVFLKDAERDLFLISFEDLERPDGDNDFNDAVFYVTSNPVSAIEDASVLKRGAVIADADGDGVVDSEDNYPDDASIAFNNYYPSQASNGTLAFEDLWPSKGDYDFNDLVLEYNFNSITNANNEVVKLEANFIVKFVGGSHRNGFAFEMENILSNQVSSVTGSSLLLGETQYITISSTGVEEGQTNATIIVFDNAWYHFAQGDQYDPRNISGDSEIDLVITFKEPIPIAQFGAAPFNPFIMVNKTRGREVHLPNYSATDLADPSYFFTYDDATDSNEGKGFKSVDNLPWALNIPTSFAIPVEKEAINKAYLKFIPWVQSNGTDYKDWYLPETGYRNLQFLY